MFSLFGIISKLGVLGVILGLSAGAYAMTASNTVPTTKAGDGSSAISGYTISSTHYVLNSSNPQNVDSFTFNVDTAPAAGSTIKARIVSTGTFITCSSSGTAVTCPSSGTLSSVTVASLDNLDVLATQ